MNKAYYILIIFLFLHFYIQADSQNIAPQYEVADWHGFRKAAISYTFDDGCPNQFVKAIPMFNEYGYKMTLFTVTNWVGNWQNLKNAAAGGHEIANHTVSHPHLAQQTIEQQKTELETASVLINNKLDSNLCHTMAYPYCEPGNDSLCRSLFIAVRGCQGFIESKTPGNFMNVSSVICGEMGSVKTEANFQNMAANAASKSGWLVYLIHGIDNDGGYSPLSSEILRASLQYLSINENIFWVSPFGTVARYIKERNSLSVEEILNQENLITLAVSDTMDNEIFNTPVTIRRILPEGWSSVNAYQNDTIIKADISEVDGFKYVSFDAIPDGGEIKLIKYDITGISRQSDENPDSDKEFKIWLRNNSLVFNLPGSAGNNISVSIFDLKGTRVLNILSCETIDGKGSVDLSGIKYLPGIYIVKASSDQSSWSKKIKL